MMKKKLVLLPAAALLVLTGCGQGDSVAAMTPEEGKKTADSIKTDYEEGNVKLPDFKAFSADFEAGANLDITMRAGGSSIGGDSLISGLAGTDVKGSVSASGSASAFDTDSVKAADFSAKASGNLAMSYDLSSVLGTQTDASSASQKIGFDSELQGEISDAEYYGYKVSTTNEVNGMSSSSAKSEKVKVSDYSFSAFKTQIASYFGLDSLDGLTKIPALPEEAKKSLNGWIDEQLKIGTEASEDTPYLITVGTMKNGNIVFDAVGNPAYISKAAKDGISRMGDVGTDTGASASEGSYEMTLTPGENAVLSATARLVLGSDYLPVSFTAGYTVKNYTVAATMKVSTESANAGYSYSFSVKEISANVSVSFRYGNEAKRAFELKDEDKAAYKEEK
jgi:hypothetical protein